MTLSGILTIDLDAIAANWRALDAMSGAETAAVVKADAYGCGAAQVSAALAKAGARTFFVANPEEGATLRNALGPTPTIYILGGYPADATLPHQAAAQSPPHPIAAQSSPTAGAWGGSAKGPVGLSPAPKVREEVRAQHSNLYTTHSLRPVLNSAPQAAAWFHDHPDALCAVQLDTGMNRLGMEAAEFASLGPLPAAVQLITSHLACADEPRHAQNAAQLAEFTRMTDAIPGIPRSLCATAGILLGAEYHFDMTRPGIGLYGGWPLTTAQPAVSLHLPIIQIRDLAPGETVGYGATWTARRPSRIATLSGGYADGLIRAMGPNASNVGAKGYLCDHPLPFAGRVSMDLITLDVTDCPAARPGAMVELLGPQQTIDDLAISAGSIGHEILTSLGTRYRRRYTET